MTAVAFAEQGPLPKKTPDAAWEARKQALHRLQTAVSIHESGITDTTGVISVALPLCDDNDQEVRHTALSLCGQLASPGDNACVQAALSRARDHDSRVRTTALQVLGQLARAEDWAVIEAAAKGLQDWHRPARKAALNTLRRLASEAGGNAAAAAATAELLEDPQNEWRKQVAEAIGDIAVASDPGTIELVAKRLESSRREVRAAAQDALPHLSHQGDPLLVEAVLKRLGSEVDYIRVAAGQAVMRVVSKTDAKAAEAVGKRLEHENLAVRTAASLVLARFQHKVARPVVLSRLHHENAEVRCSALAGLASIARGDMASIRAVSKALQDPSGAVRTMAIPMIRSLTLGESLKCSVAAAKLASLALEHPDVGVQEAGSLALVGIAQAQSPQPPKPQYQSQPDLESQLDDVRRTHLANLKSRRTYTKKDGVEDSDSDQSETLGKISQEELTIVMAMLDREEAGQVSARATAVDQDRSVNVLLSLTSLAERARTETIHDKDSEDGSEVDLNDSDESESSETSEEAVAEVERPQPKKRLQEFVKKAFLGKMASKSTRRRSANAGKGNSMSSIAAKLAKEKQKEGRAMEWENVEELLKSGDAKKRENGMQEVGNALGGSGAGLMEVVRRRIAAKKAIKAAISDDPSWRVRFAAVEALTSLASESNSDLLALATPAASDKMWQVRAAAAKACASICIKCCECVDATDAQDALTAIKTLVKDWHGEVALEALAALKLLFYSQMSGEGSEATFAAALEHRDSRVRAAGADILQHVASTPGHEVATAEAAAAVLEHEEGEVKEEARTLLKHIGPSSAVVSAIKKRLSDSYDEQTRCAGLRTLADVAQLGDSNEALLHLKEQLEEAHHEANEGHFEEPQELLHMLHEQQHHAIEAARATVRIGLLDPAGSARQETLNCLKEFKGPVAWRQALHAVQDTLAPSTVLDPVQRCAALRAVSCLFAASDTVSFGVGARGGPAESMDKEDMAALLELVASCLEDENDEVRDVAATVLQGLADHGGRNRAVPAIAFAAKRLGHERGDVRKAAEAALARLGGCMPRRAMPHRGGRRLSKDGTSGNSLETARAACEALGSEDPARRRSGSSVLVRLAADHMITAVSLAAGHLQTEDKGILADTIETICQMGAEGNPDVSELIGVHLVSISASTREASLKLLSALSPKGSIGDAVSSDGGEAGGLLLRQRVTRCLTDKVPEVRAAAVSAFAKLVRPVDKDIVSAIALQLPQMSSALRRDVLTSLAAIWSEGLIDASGPKEAVAVAACLEDESPEVRELVATLLRSSQARGDPNAVSVVATKLCLPQQEMRDAAIEALCAIADGGSLGYDKGAVAAVAVYIDCQDWDVRKSSVEALLRLVPQRMQGMLPCLVPIVEARGSELWESQKKARTEMIQRFCNPTEDPTTHSRDEGRKLIREFMTRSLLDSMEEVMQQTGSKKDLTDVMQMLTPDTLNEPTAFGAHG